jgi:indoleamine 2,3-dioxygenase
MSAEQVTIGPDTAAFLEAYDIHPMRGFLPSMDPLTKLPKEFSIWEEIVSQLPKYLVAGMTRKVLRDIPILDSTKLVSERHQSRAMLLLSYFGHAYVWGESRPEDTIPAGIAVPWYEVAQSVGRPPVLSYASHALYNWRRLDPAGPIALGNIARLENFLGGSDEDWFVLVHIDIESKAGPALAAICEAQKSVSSDDPQKLEQQLDIIAAVIKSLRSSLARMPEKCDPYIYYNRVRPFIFGWKDNPSIPIGIIYEGVVAYHNTPQVFRGETGAQSSIIPSIDVALGINYAGDPLAHHLEELRNYMPPKHRQFIRTVGKGPSIREYIIKQRHSIPSLADSYNTCVQEVHAFRAKHLEYAAIYIHAQSQRDSSNPVEVGTGGTPFMHYLKQHLDELQNYII